MDNIILIGFMGTGKTTVSKHLSGALAKKYIDMDSIIEETEGMTISEIFEKYGEEHFRNLETQLLAKLENRTNTVISCGGGIILREENVKEMKKIGRIVLLTANADTVLKRIKNNSKRPILKDNKKIENIKDLMAKRCRQYRNAADLVVSTDGKTVSQICKDIVNGLSEKEEKLILASASPRRKEIMEQAGLKFDIMISDKEEVYTETDPQEIVKELALQKASDIVDRTKKQRVTVIGADTVVVHNGKILGKPKSENEAFAMIKEIEGDQHQVYTGIAVIRYDACGRKTIVSEAVETKVYVHKMEDAEIYSYLEKKEYEDKAGAYAIQGKFAPFIEKIEGDYYNVVGLPISHIYQVLKKLR